MVKASVPLLTVVPPVYKFVPFKVSVPVPDFTSPSLATGPAVAQGTAESRTAVAKRQHGGSARGRVINRAARAGEIGERFIVTVQIECSAHISQRDGRAIINLVVPPVPVILANPALRSSPSIPGLRRCACRRCSTCSD